MKGDPYKVLAKVFARVLKPLIQLWLKRGFSYKEFDELSRRVFVEVADKDFIKDGKKQTDSRISVMTGLTRHQIAQFRKEADLISPESAKSNRYTRVLTAWLSKTGYQDETGKALPLPFEGPAPSFLDLVRQFGGDVPPKPILDELRDRGNVTIDDNNFIHLKKDGYVPEGDEDAMLEILGYDTGHLLGTILKNINATSSAEKRLHKKVAYTNIPDASAEAFQRYASKKTQAFLLDLNEFLESCENKHPESNKNHKETGLCVFLFEEDAE